MYSAEQIVNILKGQKKELEKKYPISELALFESYARGDNHEQSDIDILVDFNGRIGIEFITFAHELEDLFKTKVDLVSRKGIKPYYLPFVEQNLIHVWTEYRCTVEWYCWSYSEYNFIYRRLFFRGILLRY